MKFLIFLLCVTLFGSHSFAQIQNGVFNGKTNQKKDCFLNIKSIQYPSEILTKPNGKDKYIKYLITFQSSLRTKNTLIAKLYLSCLDTNCKKFSTNLRQIAKTNFSNPKDDVSITLSSNPSNQGSSPPIYGSNLPLYIPTQVSAFDEVCDLTSK